MPHPWEVGDETERWKGCLHPVYNLTLRTKLGTITTPDELRRREADFVERRLATLDEHRLPGTYDLEGLQAVHRHLFQDVYEWAGDLRTTGMGRGRGDDRVPFLPVDAIASAVGATAAMIRDTDLLRSSAKRTSGDLSSSGNWRRGERRTGGGR